MRNLLTALGAGLAGLLGLRALGAHRGFILGITVLAVFVALLLALVGLYWQRAVVALAIAALCALGVAVMFQRVKPGQAFRGAATALVLMFFFTWLAIQLGSVFFGGEYADWAGVFDFHALSTIFQLSELDTPSAFQNVLLATGVALLCAALISTNRLRPWLIFIGLSLILLFAPDFLERCGFLPGFQDFLRDPFYLLLALLALSAVFVRLVEHSRANGSSKEK